MDAYNQTTVTHFILIGLSDRPEVRYPLFVVFSIIYQVTVGGNGAILLAIGTEKKLHTPMYYFLSNLSFCNICRSSTISPKMLADFLSEQKRIPYDVCAIQMYFFGAFRDVECLMLAVMA